MAEESEVPAELAAFIAKQDRGWEARMRFARVMVAFHGLSKDMGYGLPQKLLAGFCGVSVGTVSRWLKTMQEMGLIKRYSGS